MISWRGWCLECANERQVTEITSLRHHTGPDFQHWRRQMAASVGGVLLDDVADSP